MTTIAARGGVIAGDGVETDDDIVVARNCMKVYRLRDGRILGSSGNSEPCEVLLEAMKKKTPIPKLEHMSALMFDTKRKLWLYEGIIWRPIGKPFYAIGSGACFALAAMMAGADAVEACRIGAELDPYSGGKVRWVKIGRR